MGAHPVADPDRDRFFALDADYDARREDDAMEQAPPGSDVPRGVCSTASLSRSSGGLPTAPTSSGPAAAFPSSSAAASPGEPNALERREACLAAVRELADLIEPSRLAAQLRLLAWRVEVET